MEFARGHGTGNDFVLLPDLGDGLRLTAEMARALCDRRTGLGGDGVIRAVRGPSGRWWMDHRNADGTTAQMCGNGIRLYARWLVDSSLAAPGELLIDTRSGTRTLHVPVAGDITVDMGPVLVGGEHQVRVGGRPPSVGTAVSTGNPHVVARVDPAELAGLDLSIAPALVPDVAGGANVELVALTGPTALRMRVHERGVGETASCGTGACAAAAAAAAWSGWTSAAGLVTWKVSVPGGDLQVTLTGSTLLLAGPAVVVATGEVDPRALGLGAQDPLPAVAGVR